MYTNPPTVQVETPRRPYHRLSLIKGCVCVLLTAYSVILVVFLGGYRDYSGAVGFINSVFFSISVHKLFEIH